MLRRLAIAQPSYAGECHNHHLLELERDGMIPGAVHASRGLLEFLVDPESPYYKDVFDSDKKLILYCATGMRSALAAQRLQELGLQRIAHVGGGITAWKAANGPVAAPPAARTGKE